MTIPNTTSNAMIRADESGGSRSSRIRDWSGRTAASAKYRWNPTKVPSEKIIATPADDNATPQP